MTSSNSPHDDGPRKREISQKDIDSILQGLEATKQHGRTIGYTERVRSLEHLTKVGGIRTLEILLPMALRLQGKPYTLADHFPFSPVFRCNMPRRLLLKTGRQVSKSTSLASHGVVLSNCIPYFRTLYITPLYEQIRRFSNNYVRPFIDQSPIKPLWSGTSTENSVLQRSFKNLSTMIFSFALLDADRVRGVSADCVSIDEIQDMDPDHLPVINETLSHSEWGIQKFAGTPKSMDNAIEALWRLSSQAEWIIPCSHCTTNGFHTKNIPSREFHIDRMIGPVHPYISAKHPAVICHKCGQSINPRAGAWVHRWKDRRHKFAGYHVPQIIMPLHYSRHDKWSELCAKREGWGNTPINVFYNEVLGESVDSGQKLVSETQLRKASSLPWTNTPNAPSRVMTDRLKYYKNKVLAVDWGGGGEAGVSFTALALLGMLPTGKIECLWGKRLVLSAEHLREAIECGHWLKQFGCDLLVHDYTGAGVVRETVLVQAGFDLERVMAVQYVPPASKKLIKYIAPTPLHDRGHYRLDKTRSLLYTFEAIKNDLLTFFAYDHVNDDNTGLISDFLALIEDKKPTARAGDLYTIQRNPILTDDFAQAVNIGCAALWHLNGWPNFAKAANVGRITADQLKAAGHRDYGWDEDKYMGRFGGMP